MNAVLRQASQRPGPNVKEGAVSFRVWAPERHSIDMVLVDSDGHEQKKVPLICSANGYFSTEIADLPDGSLYFYQLDGTPKNYPDPASHFQPQGVFGPSQVVDHRR